MSQNSAAGLRDEVAHSAPSACVKSSPAEPSSRNIFQAGGGLVNVGGGSTIQQMQVFLDDRPIPIQDRTYGSPVNVADVTGGFSGIEHSDTPHKLTLKIVRQTVSVARYQSFMLSIIVGNTKGHVMLQQTFPDQYLTISAGGTMNFTFTF